MALLIVGFVLSALPAVIWAADPLTASATPTSNSVRTGAEAIFTVTASGGTPPYKYQWFDKLSVVPGGLSAKFKVTQTSPGTFTYYCKVTDSAGQTVSSNKVTLTVTSPSAALEASASPVSTAATTGQSVSFAASVSGGTTPYTYQWFEGTNLVSGQTNAQLTITKDTAGSYAYYCKITDADGKTIDSNTVALEVTSPPTTTSESEVAFPPEAAYAIAAVVIILVVIVAVAMVLRKRAK